MNATPTVTSTTPASRCGSGSVTLLATASVGTLSWFNTATGGVPLASGTSYTTPNLGATTIFYVETANSGCSSVRTAVTATVNAQPVITATTPASRCDSGSLTLSATASAGTVQWFGVPSGGVSLATGSSFVTPVLTASATYYVEVGNGSCTSPRTAVTASINPTPAPLGTTSQSFCSGETVGLIVVNGNAVIWYDSATAGNVVAANTALVSGTTYYASQTVGGCESPVRLGVTVTSGPCLGIRDIEKPVLEFYPNPVEGSLHVRYSAGMKGLQIVNMIGQLIREFRVNDTDFEIDMSGYPAGTYLVLVDDGLTIQRIKVVKK
ncbi:MAG: T9SS type A sorting domain-containing protein [Cytophagaceae bacterium]|nr:MAG: T9SS type A sorting domain-containing protein [Cytophagaceae bacterium]